MGQWHKIKIEVFGNGRVRQPALMNIEPMALPNWGMVMKDEIEVADSMDAI